MPVQTFVQRPETFEMLIWDGSNDSELEAFHPVDSSGGRLRVHVHRHTPYEGASEVSVAIVTDYGSFRQAVNLTPGTGVYYVYDYTLGRFVYHFVNGNEYQPYGDVYVTP